MIVAGDSEIHRPGFRGLCGEDGGQDHRTHRANGSFPTQGHPVHEYPEEPLKEVHESPYRIIYGYSETEFRVVTIVHFKQQLEKGRLPMRRSQ